jgi:hypothetical protein
VGFRGFRSILSVLFRPAYFKNSDTVVGFSGIARQIFVNCDIELWKSFAVNGHDFTYSDILHTLRTIAV